MVAATALAALRLHELVVAAFRLLRRGTSIHGLTHAAFTASGVTLIAAAFSVAVVPLFLMGLAAVASEVAVISIAAVSEL